MESSPLNYKQSLLFPTKISREVSVGRAIALQRRRRQRHRVD
ncbi:MAG TPA: hypothetical protein V6D20_17160 [Candidatus Obscuribacterales bacterium]